MTQINGMAGNAVSCGLGSAGVAELLAGTPSDKPQGDMTVSEPETQGSIEKNRIHVSDLMGNDREVFLLFNGAEYRLRVTNNNKLILTK
ncbi:hemin uptake protein HemP [Nisaea acidiphila]|uniref:Hemin uptake protein HemP n=1 Tax=Nisaea acidiphila TaxID=1862145 RepID=A0A9J7AUE5_9PROT|nr:hemin uptake protein HemP [Nisaea acidiphila]UUX49013.1 hemin uptake protein HemP [Nisaea acidiphila]